MIDGTVLHFCLQVVNENDSSAARENIDDIIKVTTMIFDSTRILPLDNALLCVRNVFFFG